MAPGNAQALSHVEAINIQAHRRDANSLYGNIS
jgi:hypothetical protein